MRAILSGTAYPETLLQAAIRRIRAEHEIAYIRAALMKACLNRSVRLNNPNHEKQITMSLDLTNLNIGYRLGRLFAALEKIQSEASPGLNATIRDKFYGAASGTPVAVFGNLMRLKNHHLAKLKNAGRRVNFEHLIGEIVSGLTDFPAHLTLADQGRFAIGYYHQAQDFFTKKSDKE
jgi:CRISPR-associated protein Csd1